MRRGSPMSTSNVRSIRSPVPVWCLPVLGPENSNLGGENRCDSPTQGIPLAVSYTRAAAQEVIHRLGSLHERVTACTCHSLAFSLFRQLAPTVFAMPPRLLDSRQHEREAICARCVVSVSAVQRLRSSALCH